MGYYALFYEVVDDFIARRGAYRDEHLRLAREAHARGELMLAGALADPADGALLIFQGESPAAAEAFARQDPHVENGLLTTWKVRNPTVVVGNQPPPTTPSLALTANPPWSPPKPPRSLPISTSACATSRLRSLSSPRFLLDRACRLPTLCARSRPEAKPALL